MWRVGLLRMGLMIVILFVIYHKVKHKKRNRHTIPKTKCTNDTKKMLCFRTI